jgi:hypothetical protein
VAEEVDLTMRRLVMLLLVLVPVACGDETTEPPQPDLIVHIDKTPPDTIMHIEVLNVPLRADGRLSPDYFVGLRIGTRYFWSVQQVTRFPFAHACFLTWTITLNKVEPGEESPTRLDSEEGTGC